MVFAPKRRLASIAGPIATDDGIFYNTWSVRWDNIENIAFVHFLGLPYLRFKHRKSWIPFMRWYLPLYLGGFEQFRKDVLRYAPSSHPIRRVVDKINLDKS